jgi:hypothetical protein
MACYNLNAFKPPLSSGSGRGPLKAETWVRVPLGALYFIDLIFSSMILKEKAY